MLTDVTAATRELTEKFGEANEVYPLDSRKSKSNFRALLTAFVKKFASKCRNTAFLDEYLLQTVIAWLTALSTSGVRAFRHTCTLSALILGAQLVEARKAAADRLRKLEKQGKSDGKKAGGKGTVHKQAAETKEQCATFDTVLHNIVDGVIVHRYRDVVAEIRDLAVVHLASWIAELPDTYFNDSHIKYLGWSLSDKSEIVRRSAAVGLQKIYLLPNASEKADLFSARFGPRMVQCCEDVSELVQAAAVALVSNLYTVGHLDADQVCRTHELIFASEAPVSRAAAEFFVKVVLEDELSEGLGPDGLSGDNRSQLILKHLVVRLADVGADHVIDTKAEYAVDALWNVVPELGDWGAYLALLQQDNTAEMETDLSDTVLTPEQDVLLFEMLGKAVQRATGTLRIPGHRQPKFGSKQLRSIEEARDDVAEFFVKKLPDLFTKFGAEPAKAAVLVTLPQAFNLEVYVTSRSTSQFNATLKHVAKLFTKSVDMPFLQSCAATLEGFCENELPFHQKAEACVSGLIDNAIDAVKGALADGVPVDDSDDAEPGLASYSLFAALNRVLALSVEFEVPVAELLPAVESVTTAGCDDDVHELVLGAALTLGPRLTALALEDVVGAGEEAAVDDDAAARVADIVDSRDQLVQSAMVLLESGTAVVQRASYSAVMDLLMQFPRAFADPAVHPQFHPLALSIDADCQDKMFTYVTETVLDKLPDGDGGKRKATKMASGSKRRTKDDRDYDDDVDATSESLADLTLEGALNAEATDRKNDDALEVLDAFGRAVITNAVDVQFLGRFLSYYTKSKLVESVLKLILRNLRRVNPTAACDAILSGLEMMFEEAMAARKPDLNPAKDLAGRLALTYGMNKSKTETRKSMISIHRKGIAYALQDDLDATDSVAPKNIGFLEILKEFSRSLHKQDASGDGGVLEHLETEMRGKRYSIRQTADEWDAYNLFRKTLLPGTSGRTPSAKSASKKGSARKTTSGVKRKPVPRASRSGRRRIDRRANDLDEEDDGFWGNLPKKASTEAIDDFSSAESDLADEDDRRPALDDMDDFDGEENVDEPTWGSRSTPAGGPATALFDSDEDDELLPSRRKRVGLRRSKKLDASELFADMEEEPAAVESNSDDDGGLINIRASRTRTVK